LCLVLLSGALFYYIQAKYISSDTGDTPQASVTKWGFVVTIDGENMFAGQYVGGTKAAAGLANDEYDVRAKASSSVVTPDTSGYMTFGVKGSAEVRAQVKLKVSGADLKVVVDNGGSTYTYEPILWTLDVIDGSTVTNQLTDVTLSQLLAKMEALNPIIEVGESVDVKYRVSWRWPIESGATPDEIALHNELDSIIAKKLAEEEIDSTKYAVTASLNFDFAAVVEQVG